MDVSPELFVNLPNRVRLCYQTFGNPADPAVILIAGHGGSMLEWQEEMIPFLSPDGDRRFIIRYDHRDTGLSTEFPVPAGYTLVDMVADIEGLIDHLGLATKGVHIVGASMGGGLAYMLAARRPQQMRSLTLLYASPGANEKLPLNPEYEKINLSLTPLSFASRRDDYIRFDMERYEAMATQAIDGEEKRRLKALLTRIADREMKAGTLYSKGPNHGAAAFSERPGVEILDKITCPTTVIQAAKDQIFGVIHGEALAKGIPGADYVLWDNVGHELPKRIWGQMGEAFLQTWKKGDEKWAERSQ